MKSRWYKDAFIYQIYPRSFCDSNGDGIGDIKGIISKIDYLVDLGVTAVWLSPIYASPNEDNGYDISDYRAINPEFGTMSDFLELIKCLHDKGIRLIMDLVVNHTSSQHRWFIESRKGKGNPYYNYYHWQDGKGLNGKRPPNNWSSRFTGSSWQYDEGVGQFYLHLFGKNQPDLNWDNPAVRKEVADICKFWLDLGVDGFRCDVISYIGKNEGYPNGKFNFIMRGDEHFVLTARCHLYLKELNYKVWSNYDTLIVGETPGITSKDANSVINKYVKELDSAISFEHMEVDMKWGFFPIKLNLPKLKKVFSAWQNLPIECFPTLYVENHDQPRAASRWARNTKTPQLYRDKVAKMNSIMLYFQRGTPYIYQGQELGMTNITLKEDEYIDIMATRIFSMIKKFCRPLLPLARYAMANRARDHARTPMQWSTDKNAGFSSGKPWFYVNPNYVDINVETETKDPDSVLNFYKKIIQLRLNNNIIINGNYMEYNPENNHLYVYTRTIDKGGYLVISNFSPKTISYLLPSPLNEYHFLEILNNYTTTIDINNIQLLPYQAVVLEMLLDD